MPAYLISLCRHVTDRKRLEDYLQMLHQRLIAFKPSRSKLSWISLRQKKYVRSIFQFKGQPNAFADAAFIVQACNAHAGFLSA
jgi:hypothetical protein